MKPLLVMTLVAATASMTSVAFAQERGRVLSTTPITQQVAVPQQVCSDQTVAMAPRNTGAGAVIGAIAGGVLGNAVGGGAGRAAATAAGVVGGAMLGNQAEAYGPPQYQTLRQCSTQNYYQNQTVGYNVVYEYRGRSYTTQTTTPPGNWIALNVTPADNGNLYNSNGYYDTPAPSQVYSTVPMAPPVVYQDGYPGGYQSGYYAPQPLYSAGDYVAPMLIGGAIGAGAYYATRPHHHGYYRPGWDGGWRR